MSYTPDFHPEPPRPTGIFQWFYVYINSLLEFFIGYYYPGQIQRLLEKSTNRALELEESLLWRPKQIDCEKLSEKEILKELKGEVRQEDGPWLLKMICSIKKFQRLRHEIEMKRATRVTRELHRDHLEHLYELIKEEKINVGLDKEEDKLEDSKEKPDWVSIGFQGSDPITDFRGGGLLSLSQLIYFCENYQEKAKNLNLRASHPTKGYGLAITGINLTVLLTKALQAGALKKYFYNTTICEEQFNIVFSECILYFDFLWKREDPEDIMQFSFIFDIFRADFEKAVKNGDIPSIPSSTSPS
ncbi:Oidioi.mRNA.OKI2018_I69.chr1.g2156.t1.cds [Oikopleura dioica]|uniref:Oidioi.mRNA.OKI2018_I69.chr1.g2156.t1.cds n=1 Tax=Oikopleura dioica TaxID=34765 RepID=A0ABN7STS3_OIKDI|nr:Oidioi.mRNA.OKI2018_I69.chr1.g2156.t1.cds [Oikopleura dioica]